MPKVHISPGNDKLGKIPNISLLPGASCVPGALCWRQGCYAQKFCRIYSGVHRAWADNLSAYRQDPGEYFRAIWDYIYTYRPKYFRWHVGGDIPDDRYMRYMVKIAEAFPRTKFLAFTKRFDLNLFAQQLNLQIVLSRWPGMAAPSEAYTRIYPQAYMFSSGSSDTSLPAGVVKDSIKKKRKFWCTGKCYECQPHMRCWKMKPGEFVVFEKH